MAQFAYKAQDDAAADIAALPEELITIDDAVVDVICAQLDCAVQDLVDWEPMKIGLTNSSYKFAAKGAHYVLRLPGENTEKFLSRSCEARANETARELGIDQSLIYIDGETGLKLSHFLEDCFYIDPYDGQGDQATGLAMLKQFHQSGATHEWVLDFTKQTDVYVDIMNEAGSFDFTPYEELNAQMHELSDLLDTQGMEKTLCHNDTWYWNFLKTPDGNVNLIDWEYAGMNYPQSDVANFVISLDVTEEQYVAVAELYEGHELSLKEKRFYFGMLSLCTWYWFVWSLYTETTGKEVEDQAEWYRKATYYRQRALDLFKDE